MNIQHKAKSILLQSLVLCSILPEIHAALTEQKSATNLNLQNPQSTATAKQPQAARTSSVLSELMEVEAGELPVIISAPHGGSLNIEGSTERKGTGAEKFVVVRDTYTDRLARAVADALKEKTGKRPHLVIAHFARRHVDANRPAAGAYENDSAKRVYEAYHAALGKARDAVIRDFGRGIVIDIHGQGAERNTIFRGTQNRSTVKTLLKSYGEEAFSGEKSVLGFLVKRGYTVKPRPSENVPEDSRYNGGYITQTYGSQNGGAIDGIQLEFGAVPRSPDQFKKTANDLADALISYSETYLGLKRTSERLIAK